MASFQQIVLMGNVGKDPEVITTQSGKKIANTSLGVGERGYKKSDGTEVPDTTEWFNLSFFGNVAEVVEKYVHKGDLIFATGKLRTESYEKNGEKRYITKVLVDRLQLMPKGTKDNAPGNEQKPLQPLVDFSDVGDDLPF